MDLRTLLDESSVDAWLRAIIDELVALKAVRREIGSGEVPTEIIDLMASKLDDATEHFESAEVRPTDDAIALCEEFFVRVLERWT